MKNKLYTAGLGLMLLSLAFPSYAQASDGEEYITISVDAVLSLIHISEPTRPEP